MSVFCFTNIIFVTVIFMVPIPQKEPIYVGSLCCTLRPFIARLRGDGGAKMSVKYPGLWSLGA